MFEHGRISVENFGRPTKKRKLLMCRQDHQDCRYFPLVRTQHNISVRNTFPRVCCAEHTLGFTHYWGKTRKGGYAVKRKTAAKRLNRSLKAINQWLQRHMHLGIREQWQILRQKLQGHFAYYGITGNGEALEQFREEVKRLWHKWLDRRTRRRGGMTWERFNQLIRRRFPFPPARVVHSIYAANS